jgi:hypothetical protein
MFHISVFQMKHYLACVAECGDDKSPDEARNEA